jgi:CubicO group peptidase (beta-lactamase class C family)
VSPRGLAVLAIAQALFGSACSREAPAPQVAATPVPTPTPRVLVRDHLAFTTAVDAIATDALKEGPIAGLSIAVFERGLPVLAKGYGFADLEAKTPATPETSYPVASVSKRFTAALILRLADQGKLGLDDPLSSLFPEARPRIGALTIRHLLDHTSGLTRGGPAPKAAAQSVLMRGGTLREQGETWDYSNYNFSLLGLAIERVTGRAFAEYLRTSS